MKKVNLSNHVLTQSQQTLLDKGLKFCPTPGEPVMAEIRRDLDRFHRSLKLNVFFSEKREFSRPNTPFGGNNDQADEEDHTGPPPYQDRSFNERSIWEPTQNPLSLEAFALVNELKLAQLKPTCPKRQNITKAERKAIKELSNNKDIVIKPADKGGATVILNTTDYITEGLRQLSDPHFYRDMRRKISLNITTIM
jgi:hypothetical protein